MMTFWCPFLDAHLTTYHWNVGAQIIVVTELGLSILCKADVEELNASIFCPKPHQLASSNNLISNFWFFNVLLEYNV